MGLAASNASKACFAAGSRCFSANTATVSCPRQPHAWALGASVPESAIDAKRMRIRAETGRITEDSSRTPPIPPCFCKKSPQAIENKRLDPKKERQERKRVRNSMKVRNLGSLTHSEKPTGTYKGEQV